jgi:hypothetical protein
MRASALIALSGFERRLVLLENGWVTTRVRLCGLCSQESNLTANQADGAAALRN